MSQELTFGGWLRQRRTELDVTRDVLAERVGYSPDLLRKLESGERRPSAQIALLLADYFSIPADEREAFVTFAHTGRAARGAANTTAPWRATYVRQTNLPALLTPLIGREQEIAAARDQILNPRTRLLTLTGAPGIGKTRLGLQVASGLVGHSDDGVFLVDLSPVVDPDLVLATIARTLGLKDEAARPLESALFDFVRERRMLLLLDNFEQVLDAAPEIVRLLEASPWLKILVTSREPLHVRGEKRLTVPPLQLPQVPEDPEGSLPVEDLAGYPSVELFVERAQAVLSNFTLTRGNAQDVAGVCIRVDGLPLAIELAAAHAVHLTPAEIRAGLAGRPGLLTGAMRDLPARHRTLHAAIEWSYDLLDEVEQHLFRRLGVFVSGFSSDAAEGVTGNPFGTVKALRSLVDKNLVKQVGRATPDTPGGKDRFGLLETIREFALHRLAMNGESEAVRWQHARYYLSLAEDALPRMASPDSRVLFEQLESEHDNFRAALRWLLDYGEADVEAPNTASPSRVERIETALRLCAALWVLWIYHGHVREGRRWFEAAHARTLELVGLGTDATDGVRAAAELSQTLPDLWAKALSGIGLTAQYEADYDTAILFHKRSLAIRRELGDRVGISSSVYNLGNIATFQGQYAAARCYHVEALELAQEPRVYQGRAAKVANILSALGSVECAEGDYVEARALFEEVLALTQETGDKRARAAALNDLGVVAYHQGNYALARSYYEEAIAGLREQGDKHTTALALLNFGILLHDQGSVEDALAHYQEALLLLREQGDKRAMAECLEAMAALPGIGGSAGDPDAVIAARLYGAASALREALHCPLRPSEIPRYERFLAASRQHLAEPAWELAWAEGRAMSMEQAVGYALEG